MAIMTATLYKQETAVSLLCSRLSQRADELDQTYANMKSASVSTHELTRLRSNANSQIDRGQAVTVDSIRRPYWGSSERFSEPCAACTGSLRFFGDYS